ncbi:MAG: four helix bundle protein [Candidatus Omnitrophica bacterium]|nr:four helix bundle protein [Candidatus Omnitrophota bacterium]
MNSFENLIVWQKAHIFVIEIYRITKDFPKEESVGIISQIRRSTFSICVNIAEGHKKTRKDFARFLDIAQGSLEETKYYLILAKDLHYYREEKYLELKFQSEEIGKLLTGLIRSLRS